MTLESQEWGIRLYAMPVRDLKYGPGFRYFKPEALKLAILDRWRSRHKYRGCSYIFEPYDWVIVDLCVDLGIRPEHGLEVFGL